MKRRIINTVVALMAMATAGNAQQLSVSEVKAEAGAQSEITVNLTGATDKTALQYNLSLPAGLTLAPMGKIVHGQWPFFIGYVGFFFLVVLIPKLSLFLLAK